jgi:hypothetical protein
MKARARTAAAAGLLLVVALAVGAVAYWGVHLRGREEREAEARSKKVLAFDPAKVREVRVVRDGAEVRVVRDGGRWRIEAPLRTDADAATVDRLLAALSALERRSRSAAAGASSDTLRAYGLAVPRTRLEVLLDGGGSERLALGDDSGFDGAMFVMPASGEVDVVASAPRADLEPSLDALRDRRVLRFDREEAFAVRIEGDGPPTEVRRESGAAGAPDAWRIVLPRPAPAEAWKASGLVSALASLEAAAFPGEGDAALRAAGLDRPRRTYAVLGRDGKELARLALGAEREGRVPARSGASTQVYALDAWRLRGLAASAKDLAPEPPGARAGPTPAPASAPPPPVPAPAGGPGGAAAPRG